MGGRDARLPPCYWPDIDSMPFLDENASDLINAYNRSPAGRRYNQVADEVYRARHTLGDPLSPEYVPHILTGLIGFDMGRTMEGGSSVFATRLRNCIEAARESAVLDKLRACRLSSADLAALKPVITSAYNCLGPSGTLHSANQSHVSATKTLHWLFPDLFLILDSNVTTAFREHFGVEFQKSTQPGYSSDRYFTCLREAQKEIRSFGVDRFRQLEPMTPEARIFDKVAFVAGQRVG